ncbi:MAG: DUF3052 domain-containing protein [Blastomonas sp.]|uniref:DUF3052 family protein n=1 Tax=unclassified Blastomonas TaxID=2626550 RepID=UPI00082CA521|nr:DUF3052 family protein [Blastomonas sp.]MCH2237274.1 DUF3052 domain-containing protein [Blastomonas sp.]OHD01719.1 MAG: hypothetical protein A2885_07100 [Sphingopyxis sp. RIFCSPHIGHO2_01_FULL_65_24]
MTTGYSGTPLARKLGLKPGMRVWFDSMPDAVRAEIEAEVETLETVIDPGQGFAAAHLFTTERAVLERELARLMASMDRDGMIWVSWPKKAAKLDTDITEDVIRSVALPMGLVDVKVCAVDATWSGLKLVIRKELR